MRLRAVLLAVSTTVWLWGCSIEGGTSTTPPTESSPPATAGLVLVSNPGNVTDVTHVAGKACHYRDGTDLPDPSCTPGSIDPKITASRLCDPDYTTGYYRPESSEMARYKYPIVGAAYGITTATPAQFDHLVNLDLAGSNDLANLWNQPGGTPNKKDAVERHLHNWVCELHGPAAEDRLRLAQVAIATDWETAEKALGIHP